MLVTLTPDQELFRDTTARFLEEHVPVGEVRRLRDDPDGLDPGYWRRGAELGWTSLLVGEAHGGGSLSGAGLVDLSLVAYEFGRHAAPGPLVPVNLVAAALSEHDAHPEVRDGLIAGRATASWCGPGLAGTRPAWEPGVEIRRGAAGPALHGLAAVVEGAARAAHHLVTARDGDGVTQVLVPASAPGVAVTPLQSVDLTRRFAAVALDGVRVGTEWLVGPAGEASAAADRQARQLLALLSAESVGAMQAGFDMTVSWSFDRYSFGRPLASYQALKHRFADMLTWLEAAHAVTDAACRAVGDDTPEADELASAAKAFVGHYGGELLQDCVQLHGGMGVTFEHDLHLYLRRFTVNRMLAGTPAEHRRRVAALLDAGDTAA